MITYTYTVLSLHKEDVTIPPAGKPPGAPGEYKNFISYEDLTEQNVIDWYCDGIRNLEAENDIKQQFELEAGTKVDSNFPWD